MTAFNKLLYIFFIIIISACNNDQTINKHKVQIGDESNYIVIADTIINDVVIKNPNNDEWTDYCLRNLDKETFVNKLFKLVYSGELTPYDFFLDTPMTIEEVKTIEKDEEYNRDNIAKVQFEESWYFDFENHKMLKKVQSVMIAYEIYDNEGKVKGYKPVFKVYFK